MLGQILTHSLLALPRKPSARKRTAALSSCGLFGDVIRHLVGEHEVESTALEDNEHFAGNDLHHPMSADGLLMGEEEILDEKQDEEVLDESPSVPSTSLFYEDVSDELLELVRRTDDDEKHTLDELDETPPQTWHKYSQYAVDGGTDEDASRNDGESSFVGSSTDSVEGVMLHKNNECATAENEDAERVFAFVEFERDSDTANETDERFQLHAVHSKFLVALHEQSGDLGILQSSSHEDMPSMNILLCAAVLDCYKELTRQANAIVAQYRSHPHQSDSGK